ncbi:molybdopterin-containing oxidoreductase family protein [Sphingopyxis sp.]|uniref:molybdopterin-containing oxidoreductase family protein n=1 Tax=Sphingopyxis sp. TaxID=1908224 RepID=UPI003F6FE998
MTLHHSFCRLCLNGCALKVEVEDGVAVKVGGDKDNPVYRGFTCVKGREQGRLLVDPRRLRHSLRRKPDGRFEPIGSRDAIGEIATRLETIAARHGREAIAGYLGTYFAASAATMPFFGGFMAALGSPMAFSPGTIDKPGKKIAQALHGDWDAPAVGFDDPEVIFLIGSNPLISFTGFPYGNPGKWLNERLDAGARLIVLDPRRSDVAKRAHIHLQAKAGEDVAIIAAMIRIVIAEALYDPEFIARHAQGLGDLTEAVAAFDATSVAARAGIDPDALVEAARILGGTRRGYIMAGTGPNMSGRGTLIEYLLLNLHTLCGYWLRAGDHVRHPGALAAPVPARAQVRPFGPAYAFGPDLGVRALGNTAAGMPTAALPDLILGVGKMPVRALISCGGNPVGAWPDQAKTLRAMDALDLLVQIDPWMSATARVADFVIAPRIWLEVPGTSQVLDWLTRNGTGYGQSDPYAQYSPALLDPPPGSDLVEEWEFFYELARAMGLSLSVAPGLAGMPARPVDMDAKPSTDAVLAQLCEGSRVALDEVRKFEGGAIFPGDPVFVGEGEGEQHRFDLAAPDMIADLKADAASGAKQARGFSLLCRRMMHVYNSSFVGALPPSARPYNPVFLHPGDMSELGIEEGESVDVISDRGAIAGIAHGDEALRPGTVSMSFGFGALPEQDADYRVLGSNTTRLISNDEIWDRYSGQPLMSNVPVDVVRRTGTSDEPG